MHGKKYNNAKKLVDAKKLYPLTEALELLQRVQPATFDATIDVHARLGINPKKGGESVRSTVTFPHTTGKVKRVAAFVSGDKEKEAQSAGADLVGDEELIKEISETQKINFDVAVATPEMMSKLAKIAKILGPKGLMPNPKDGTVGIDVKKMVTELKCGKVAFKNDDGGTVHVSIGKVSMDTARLVENYTALIEALVRAKPATSKGTYIKGVTLAASMGPGVKVAYP